MDTRQPNKRTLRELASVFLKLGTTAFGGPAAHIAMMDDEVVRRRGWLSRQQFLDLLGATHLIPGPNSTEMAIHIGLARAGWVGLLVAGACFIFPAFLIGLGSRLDLRPVRLPAPGNLAPLWYQAGDHRRCGSGPLGTGKNRRQRAADRSCRISSRSALFPRPERDLASLRQRLDGNDLGESQVGPQTRSATWGSLSSVSFPCHGRR